MPEPKLISGVPASLAMDGWWLETRTPKTADQPSDRPDGNLTARAQMTPVVVLIAVVILADLLFWNRSAGVSVAVFAFGLFVLAVVSGKRTAGLGRAALVLLAGCLPVIEYLQFLSFVFLVLSFATALMLTHSPTLRWDDATAAGMGFLRQLPLCWLRLPGVALSGLREAGQSAGRRGRPTVWLRNWSFPLGGAFVFSALLIEANPVLNTFSAPDLDYARFMQRALFWTGFAMMAWPVLRADRGKAVVLRGVAVPVSGFGINAGSVVRALWVFNALIGVQTLLDLSVIFGGTALPEGMSYAEYAHRGAYPLLVMAILAAAFALAATPFLGENRVMRPLLFLWLGQNIVVCGSALMRLELYVDVYGLTYLRIYAQIWMCLVAAGLALTVWQVHSGYPTTWLVRKCSILTCAVLYGTCFVNFAQVIVDHNMALAEPDFYYLCGLDPVGGMHRHVADVAAKGYESYCDLRVPQVRYWQEWGFRTWRALP